MKVLGVFKIKFGVDSIALSRDGQWLYYAPLNGGILYRIEVAALGNEELTEDELGDRVERYADITLSDGIATDDSGNIYIKDMKNSAIHRVDPGGNLQTLFKDSKRLRWPDGFSFGPDGDLYVTESALHVVMMKSKEQIKSGRPCHVYRFKPGPRAAPRH